MLKEYYQLTKPGIVYGNALTTLAAFLFASRWSFSLGLFIATMLGIMLVIASACVFNNYLDREIDQKMTRTKERALATRKIPEGSALAYASALGIVGFALLFFFVNGLTALVALGGFIFYVIFYTFSKRYSPLGTLVGSISGAAPIVAGYTAIANRLDATALVLFLILVCWQMPHFYAIAIRRLSEYRAAHIPILPATAGIRATKFAIVAYLIAYLFALAALTLIGVADYSYLAIALIAGFAWLVRVLSLWQAPDERFGRGVFFFSLIALLAFSIALAVSALVP